MCLHTANAYNTKSIIRGMQAKAGSTNVKKRPIQGIRNEKNKYYPFGWTIVLRLSRSFTSFFIRRCTKI